MKSLDLWLLGTMSYRGAPLVMPRKARALLAFVAEADRPSSRSKLADIFCTAAADPRRTLRTLLSRINTAGPGLLTLSRDSVALRDEIWVDAQAFEKAVKNERFEIGVLDLYRAEFMAGEDLPDSPEYEMWLFGRRAHYRMLLEKTLLSIAQANFRSKNFDLSLSHTLRLVEENPYLEEGHELIIRSLVAMDQPQAAREYFDRFQSVLAAELSVAPTPRMQQFAERLLVDGSVPNENLDLEESTLPPDQRQLLLDSMRLEQWLGPNPSPETLEKVRRWATETAALSSELYAYHSADAALKTELYASTRLQTSPEEMAESLLRRILIGEYVNMPLTEQKKAVYQVEEWLQRSHKKDILTLLLLGQAVVFYREGNYSKAINAANEAGAAFRSLNETQLAGRAATIKGQSQLRIGENTQAINTLNAAQKLLIAAGDHEGQSLAYGETAWAAINLGQIDRAFSIIHQAMEQLGPLDRAPISSRLAYTLAACWNYYYDAAQMERWAAEAIVFYEQLGNQTMANRCHIYNVQADRYRLRNRSAAGQLSQLFQQSQAHHDTWTLAWTMVLMALTAFKNGRLDEAERWYSQAYGLRRQTGERQNQIYDLVYMGRLRAARGLLNSALQYTSAAVRQMEEAANAFFSWEAWDMHLAHAEVLSQNGRQEDAGKRLAAGYQALQKFLDGVQSLEHRRQIRESENAAHLLRAWHSGEIVPFHERQHRVI